MSGPTSDAVALLTQRLAAATTGRDQLVRQLQATGDPALRERVRAASSVVDYLGSEREKQALLSQLREALRVNGAAPTQLIARLAQLGLATTVQGIIAQAAGTGLIPPRSRQPAPPALVLGAPATPAAACAC
ncbi:MAG: hypothetical protein JWM98_2694 [Thermoleophilia bacterium]|nr:hypothetical protein [Thermoleophilia bacterium]